MKHLHDLDPAEVSLVPRGANKKKFLVLKSDEANTMAGEAVKKLLEDVKAMQIPADIEKVIKSAEGEEAQAALSATIRILKSVKVPNQILQQALTAAGLVEAPKVEPVAKKKDPSDEDKEMAMKAAECAYGEQMKKLGFEKYPAMQIAQKAKAETDEEEEMDENVEKSLLANVPKETQAAVQAIFKQNEELKKQNELLQKSQEDLTKRVEAVTKAAKRQEFVAKAEGFTHLGVNTVELADSLMTLSETAPKTYEQVLKTLEAANEQVSKGALFTELGSSLPGNTSGDAWSRIEAAADAFVAKSGEKVTKAEAVDKFMQTREGRQMYAEYEKQHKHAQKEAR